MRSRRLEDVERTARRIAEVLGLVGVDHRRFDVHVSQVLLDLPDIHTVEEQVMTSGRFGNCSGIAM
jgi:hypothetical protein